MAECRRKVTLGEKSMTNAAGTEIVKKIMD